jgi:hypothetical protein
VKNTARLVEHAGIAQVLRKRTPALASASMFGVAGCLSASYPNCI